MKMMRKRHLGNKGITLVGALASILVVGFLATYLGKMMFFSIRSKNRTEAKTSVIDNETTLAELITSRMKKIVQDRGPGFCGLDATILKADFNKAPEVTFPAPSIALKMEASTDANLKKFEALIDASPPVVGDALTTKNAIDNCSIQVPSTEEAPGSYLFCVALNLAPNSVVKSKSFLFSEAAFVQVRLELVDQGMSQDEKTFGPIPRCNDWINQGDSRQFKFNYRVFWKARGDAGGFYSWMGSKTLNFPELRSM